MREEGPEKHFFVLFGLMDRGLLNLLYTGNILANSEDPDQMQQNGL